MYKFEPLIKRALWGSESWEISGVKGSETIVAEGPMAGLTLNELVSREKEQLVGQENYERFGNEFPLLIKFIDARKDLSIQVHPNDEVARRHGKERGKTEMWYVLGPGESNMEAGALSQANRQNGVEAPFLYNGLKRQITPEQYKQMVENDTITEALARYEVKEGDVFFIPSGRIHSIGAGCMIVEIQQTCDVTYRIYDYKRRDKDGNLRQLHTNEAAESIDYTVLPDYRTAYTPQQNVPLQVVECPYFTTAIYDLTEPMLLDYADLDSFIIIICVKGEGTVTADGETVSIKTGETILLPATTKEVKVEGTVKFLETYV